MGAFYEKILRPLFFRLDPERAHEYGRNFLQSLGAAGPLCRWMARRNQGGRRAGCEAFGLRFPNRVGLAAGMDKDAEFVPAAAAFGFGHVEVGTVTPKPQPGNPRPRLFRYPADEALVNRMGFNNRGAEAMARRLARLPRPGERLCPVGVNIGKNKNTPLEEAAVDYRTCFETLAQFADYFTVNVSSPNTEGLRTLQEKDHLRRILSSLREANQARGERPIPVLVKISPDLSFRQIGEILEVAGTNGAAGFVATNTTLARKTPGSEAAERGGLSGRPLRGRATDVVRFLALESKGRLPVIGVGGIHDPASAAEKLDAGAVLVQLYTGWVYRGPLFARDLARCLRFHGNPWP